VLKPGKETKSGRGRDEQKKKKKIESENRTSREPRPGETKRVEKTCSSGGRGKRATERRVGAQGASGWQIATLVDPWKGGACPGSSEKHAKKFKSTKKDHEAS